MILISPNASDEDDQNLLAGLTSKLLKEMLY